MKGLKGKLARLFLYSKDPLKTMIKLREKVESTKAERIWVYFTRASTKFYKETFNYNVKSFLKQTKLPILAIGGGKDFQCHPDDTRLIPTVSTGDSETHIIEDMDHMLRLQEGDPSILSYRDSGKKPMVLEVKELISNWMNAHKSKKSTR